MIDLKLLKNSDFLKLWLQRKDRPKFDVTKLLEFEKSHNQVLQKFEQLLARHNQNSKSEPDQKKQQQIIQDKQIIAELKPLISQNQKFLNQQKLFLPNIPHAEIPLSPAGKIIYTSKHDLQKTTTNHLEIGQKLDWINLAAGTLLTAPKFVTYQNKGASLIRFLQNFCLDFHLKNNYQEFMPPHLVNEKALIGTGQLPKLKEDCYQLQNNDLFLSPTAEVQLVNLFANRTFLESELPKKVTAFTECYRREAGATSTKIPGILRLHQFKKVEIVWITRSENSMADLEKLLQNIQVLLNLFVLPYRVIELSVHDISFAAAKTYDIEVWFPAQQAYVEIASISNTTDFQARRLRIKTENSKHQKKYVHTLNGSALPLDRLLAAILENHFDEKNQTLNLPSFLSEFNVKINQ